VPTSKTFSSNNDSKPLTNGNSSIGINGAANGGDADGTEDAPGSPSDSLFGDGDDNNSLFGETAGEGAPSGGVFGDDDDEFSRAIESGLDHSEPIDSQGDLSMTDAPLAESLAVSDAQHTDTQSNGIKSEVPDSLNDIPPHVEALESSKSIIVAETQDALATSESTFLAASIDGPLRIWDRRQPNPVARIPTRTGVPPWCMAACWSPDGNYIYAGRRNGTVEEFSLHKGLKTSDRTFKFPQGSGAVSAVRAMPNGRHLIWYVYSSLQVVSANLLKCIS
jgi:transcriptional activator SPT8